MNRSGTQHRRIGERGLLVLAGAGRALLLRELARAIGVYDSSARYGLQRLIERGLVSQADEGYSLKAGGEVLDFELRNAVRILGIEESLRLVAARNEALAFLSLNPDGRTAVAILSGALEPRDVLRFRELVKKYLRLGIEEREYDRLLGTAIEDQEALSQVRQQMSHGRMVKGNLARLPQPGVRGDFSKATPLHRPHPGLPSLSRRRLQSLARRFGLAGLSLFGSSVRNDFRPDSDVDVLVRYRPETRRTLEATSALREELSKVLDRAVDLVDERTVYPALRPNIARDLVRLYGRSRARALAPGTSQAVRGTGDRRTPALR